MTPQDLHALGTRLLKHWRWEVGAVDLNGCVVVRVQDGTPLFADPKDPDPSLFTQTAAVPDLSNPSTLGWLLKQVREAWGSSGLHTEQAHRHFRGPLWTVVSAGAVLRNRAGQTVRGDSEAEVLVAAREAATKQGAA